MNIEYKGARWFKCDLHLHTPASKCFKHRDVTPEQWISAAKEAGLDCIAVTDHNCGAWIDCIKAAAKPSGIIVFPGVEITCDTSKIHLLILFDRDTTTQQVEDFLLTCGISRESFANSEAHSTQSVLEIAHRANKAGAIVIPAHIDEFNGLGYCGSKGSVQEFMNLDFINAVQFVHPELLDPTLRIADNQEIVDTINAYYGNPPVAIGQDSIKAAYDGMQVARNAKSKFLTFSDNPDADEPSKHGLSGIGVKYSWIKMDSNPDLESLRQALIMPERTKNYFESALSPYSLPSLWINRITIQNTTVTRKENVFSIDFNPQLSTIIGGRGSGKSSILRFLRGAFGKDSQISELSEILSDHTEFFKKVDPEGRGVLKENTRIEIYFVRDGLQYRIVYCNNENPKTSVERQNIKNASYELVTDEGFIDFFQFEQYSQKQIFSIAQKPNSLRNRIDGAVPVIWSINNDKKQARADYKSLMAKKRALVQEVKEKGKINTIIADANAKIQLLKQSGIAELITRQQTFASQKAQVSFVVKQVENSLTLLRKIQSDMHEITPINLEVIDSEYREEIASILTSCTSSVTLAKQLLDERIAHMESLIASTYTNLENSALVKDSNASETLFNQKKKELEEKGVTDISDFEKYTRIIEQNNAALEIIKLKETELSAIDADIISKLEEHKRNRNSITVERNNFVSTIINSDKIRVKIYPFADKQDFENRFRSITQKATGYANAIENLLKVVYEAESIEDGLLHFKTLMHQIHENQETDVDFDGRFTNMIQGLTAEQMDDIELLYPEDEIRMEYKNRDGNFKPLAVASAGQKTTAILSFILAFGDTPLILDQPEDDLDNRLVYELIVDKIRQIKENRQVIIVTHNANIPVNGDAEYVVSMSSDTHNLKIQAEGTVEKAAVKNEICEVMEGGVEAFRTRAQRYASLK